MKIEITTESINTFVEKKGIRLAIKTCLVLLVTFLSVVFFGLCMPFFLLAMHILPSLGVAGSIYVFSGGIVGLVFGGITSVYSLGKSNRLVTRSYLILMFSLLMLLCAYLICYVVMYERFSHI